MNRKIVKLLSFIEMAAAVVTYFAIAYHFDNDRYIIRILPHTDLEATILRLSIYIIPGIGLLSGFFGLVFSTRGLLSFMGVLEILAGSLALYYKGESVLIDILGIIMIVCGCLYILFTVLDRKKAAETAD